jgi:eukaryotic-like serine/threonine-protein kinase
LMEICEVLAVAHEQGIVHRDLKPENVMILRDPANPGIERVKVLDFGIAKIVDAGTSMEDGMPTSLSTSALTTVGVVVGTPAYMSPEQCRGDPVDGRSDIYTCGVMLYLLVTGRLPFQPTGAPWDVAMDHLRKTPPAPSTFLPQISPSLEATILTALSKWPAQRQQTARELRDELTRLLPWLSEGVPAGPTVTLATADTIPVESRRSRAVPSVRAVVEEETLAGGAVIAPAVREELDRPPSVVGRTTETRGVTLIMDPSGASADRIRIPVPPDSLPRPLRPRVNPHATTEPATGLAGLSPEPPDSDRPGPPDEEPSAEIETRVMLRNDPSRSGPLPPSPDGPANAALRPPKIEAALAASGVPVSSSPQPNEEPAPMPRVREGAMMPAHGAPLRVGRSLPTRPGQSMLMQLALPGAVVIGLALGVLAFLLMR